MSMRQDDFAAFVRELEGATVAIVYSYSNRVDPARAWYDRWRSDVVFFFGQGVERLGAEPRYMDVEQYLYIQGTRGDAPGAFIINLHSGLNDIGCWPVISALAHWRRIPVSPCSSDVHIVGERKDITNLLAAAAGLRLPAPYAPDGDADDRFVRKPRDLGMSRDLTVVRRCELQSDDFGTDVVQSFVAGFDATVGVIRAPDGAYRVIGAQLISPPDPKDTNWVYAESVKVADDRGIADHSRIPVEIAPQLKQAICTLCDRIGISGYYRLDFRVSDDATDIPKELTLSNAYFLEANATPTIGMDGDFAAMISQWIASGAHAEIMGEETASRLASLGENAMLVALSLFSAKIALK